MFYSSPRSTNGRQGKTQISQAESLPKRTFWDGLGRYRDVLDAVLKTGAVFLWIPALHVYSYLRLIQRTDLFAASVLSLAGLSALLEAFFFIGGLFVMCVIGPSMIIYFALGRTLADRPPKGLSNFVLLNAAVWGAVYGCLFGWFDASHPGAVYWWSFVATICAVAGFSVWLAWRSPHWMEVVPREELANPGSKTARPPNWMHGHARLEKTFYWLNRPRMWRCAGIAAAISFAGLYSVNSILTVYSFAEAYQLPEHGGAAVMILAIIVFVSFLPGATFLRARAQGHSHANAARVSMFMVGVVLMAAAMGGYFVQPLAVLTMRAMGIVDLTPRTYEILKVDDRAAYKALGYKPKAGDKFVEGVIVFQFADVKLICPSAFKLAPGWGRVGRKKDDPPVVDLSGCLTPAKDELRMVNLPERFTPTTDLSAAGKPSGR